MIAFTIQQLFPGFLLRDKDGYAMAKALEKMLVMMLSTIQNGLDTAMDVEKMPEWRLDELAWEYNCPYDYNADVEKKRRWIREANRLCGLHGTREGIYQYLAGYFDDVTIQEAGEYGGEPFHFRLVFEGLWDNGKVAWATNAVQTVKNVRSVLDSYDFETDWTMPVFAGCALYGQSEGRFETPMPELDDESYYVDELNAVLTDENGMICYVEG